ncbi:LOW QUALITY PROTEIN: zf-CCHC domain-containing protein/UBN2 domain-containing protein, partial [Cephalotus follicularis]
DIINTLKGLGKVYTNHELVSKILRCLPKSLEPRVTTIEEAKDLSTFQIEDLLGSLMTHELRMSDPARNDPRKILLDKKNFSKRQLKKFQSKGDTSKDGKNEKVICYECDKPGHIRANCPKLKKKKDNVKKKAMIETWSDSNESSFDEEENEEVTNIAFMAMEDNCEVTTSSLSYNELQCEYDEILYVFNDLNGEYLLLKKIAKDRAKENEELKNCILEMKKDECMIGNNSSLEKENLDFKLEIDGLKRTFSKFLNSNDKLDKLLGMQRCVFDIVGLGFDEMNKAKIVDKLL